MLIIISYPFDGLEYDKFDLTVASISDSVLEGNVSTVYTFYTVQLFPRCIWRPTNRRLLFHMLFYKTVVNLAAWNIFVLNITTQPILNLM